jgi:hypothetical protein
MSTCRMADEVRSSFAMSNGRVDWDEWVDWQILKDLNRDLGSG